MADQVNFLWAKHMEPSRSENMRAVAAAVGQSAGQYEFSACPPSQRMRTSCSIGCTSTGLVDCARPICRSGCRCAISGRSTDGPSA